VDVLRIDLKDEMICEETLVLILGHPGLGTTRPSIIRMVSFYCSPCHESRRVGISESNSELCYSCGVFSGLDPSPSVTLMNQLGSPRQRASGCSTQNSVSFYFWLAGIGAETFCCCVEQKEGATLQRPSLPLCRRTRLSTLSILTCYLRRKGGSWKEK
jgi:hypothetical protein